MALYGMLAWFSEFFIKKPSTKQRSQVPQNDSPTQLPVIQLMAPPERRSTASLETPLEGPSAFPPPSKTPSEALLAFPSSLDAPSTLAPSPQTPLEDPATLLSSSETSARTSRCYPDLIQFRRHVTSKYIKLQGGEKDFLPINLQKELVTRDSVLSAFKAIGETESAELDRIVDFVLRKGERVFLILVLMTYNNAEKVSALREFERAGVGDDKLPLELSNEELLKLMPKGWEDNDFELFRVHQWPLMAPTFGTNFVYHLHESQPLPYVELPSKPKGQGFFGEVSRAEIHEAHIIEKVRPAENARANNHPNGIAVAIKKAKDSQELTEFFNQEVEGLRRTNELDSPHIIKIIAAYQRGSDKCLLFLWADGGNFADYWREHNETRNMPETIRWSMEQVVCLCGALRDIHQNNGYVA
ncbi:hypothetical protein ANO14919_129270 [Xylariales sp. No.14919]|nr:hypothetical protein ANO14919_129270 [Xylariales sp. No.14919]